MNSIQTSVSIKKYEYPFAPLLFHPIEIVLGREHQKREKSRVGDVIANLICTFFVLAVRHIIRDGTSCVSGQNLQCIRNADAFFANR